MYHRENSTYLYYVLESKIRMPCLSGTNLELWFPLNAPSFKVSQYRNLSRKVSAIYLSGKHFTSGISGWGRHVSVITCSMLKLPLKSGASLLGHIWKLSSNILKTVARLSKLRESCVIDGPAKDASCAITAYPCCDSFKFDEKLSITLALINNFWMMSMWKDRLAEEDRFSIRYLSE